jgi:TonB family protein
MKRLLILLCLLPSVAGAQPLNTQSLGTSQFTTGGPAPALNRLSRGQDCEKYPGSRNKANTGGVVSLGYTVGADGSVGSVTITKSSGDIELDRGASDCVKSWKFLAPEKMGKSSVEATTTVTYTSNDKLNFRRGHSSWQSPGVRNASDIALNDIAQQVIKCLHENPAVAPLAATNDGTTAFEILYFRGEISKVKIQISGGNDTLDKAGIDCFMAIPKNPQRADVLDRTTDSILDIPWRMLLAP